MILVQKRSTLFHQIIQACKKRNLPVAGSDRLKLGSELAVRDLLALLSFLALPEDNLSLATVLRSPLFGWSEQDLYSLAANRDKKAFLWQALRGKGEEYSDTFQVLSELRERVDYQRPYELLETILTRFKARERLLARLGPEGEDGINVLLAQALAYERDAVPSLTGFLDFAKVSDTEIKRQVDGAGDLIRVMTVHGAKGLESPIVILPDTTSRPPLPDRVVTHMPDGTPIANMSKASSPDLVAEAKAAKSAAEEQERDRLLYVAMTRAEKWLIVCGVQPGQNTTKLNWHARVAEGMAKTDAAELKIGGMTGLRFQTGDWPMSHETEAKGDQVAGESLPHFGNAPAPDIFQLKHVGQLLFVDTVRVMNKPGGVGQRDDLAP